MTRIRSLIVSPWLWAAALITITVRWGQHLQRQTPEIFLGAAPLVGRDPADGWDWRFGWGLVGATAVGLAVVVATYRGWWWQISIRSTMIVTSLTAGAFAVLLAATDGRDGLLHGAADRTEYLVNLKIAPSAGQFLRNFVEDIDHYSVHVRGHPPGFMLVLKAMDAVGFKGVWPVVGLSILGTVLLPAAVLIAVRATAGDEWVRRCAPLLIVAPYAIWQVVSADAVYAAIGASGVAACTLGLRQTRWRATGWGVLAGTLLGGLLFLTYGGATFILTPLVPIGVAFRRRAPGALPTLVGAVTAGAAVTVGYAMLGFWWFDGAAETRRQYWAGTAQFRPLIYFALANLAVALIAIGPGGFEGLIRIVKQWKAASQIAPLVIGGALALAASHLSQYTRAEVERIWLLFYPWLIISGGLLISNDKRRAGAIAVAAQVVTAVLLQAGLVSKW